MTRTHQTLLRVVPLLALLTFPTRAAQPETIELNKELREMELVRYWLKDHLDMSEGAVELEAVLRFPAEETLKLEDVAGTSKAEHTFLTFIVDKGNRISVWYSRLQRTIGLVAWDRATRRHLIVESVPADWKEGDTHTLRIGWGRFLTLTVDGETIVSKPWLGLTGPWGQTEPKNSYLLVGSIKMWAHTRSDFLAKRVTFFPPAPQLGDVLAGDGELGVPLTPAVVTIPKLKRPPEIDGTVGETEWQSAAAVTGLVNVQTMMAMSEQTVFFLGYDAQRLYIGIQAFRRNAQLIDSACHVRDGAVYLDDAIEIYLRPGGQGPHYQFIGNSFGTIYDGFNGKNEWNGNWEFKTHHSDRFWSGEIAIEWAELRQDAPADGDTWTVNFCRELPKMSEIASWALIHRSYGQPDRFGKAVFSADGAAARVLAIEGLERGQISMLSATTVPGQAQLALSDGQTVLARTSNAVDRTVAPVELQNDGGSAAGQYLMSYVLNDDEGDVLTSGTLPFALLPPFDVHLHRLPSFDTLNVIVDVRGMRGLPAGAVARAAILNAAGKTLVSNETKALGAEAQFVVPLTTGTIKPGEWHVRGELLGQDGKTVHSKMLSWTKRERPWWHGSQAGIIDQVLPPWTPMTVTGTTIGCWGREITFGQSVLPEQITSQGKDLLTGPMRLKVTSDGRSSELGAGQCRVSRAAGHEVNMNGSSTANGLELSADIHAEYDGMFRFDIAISGPTNTQVDTMTLEIPLRAEHSILMHDSNGSRGWAGQTGDTPRQMVFTPTIWLGDDDRGLCWFAESAQYWKPNTAGAIEIAKEGETRFLRLKLIREQTALKAPLRYTFGLMPTPVRPLPEHVRDWRLATGIGRRTIENVVMSERVTYPAAGQFDNRHGSVELWLTPAWPTPAAGSAPEAVWQQVAGIEYGPFPGKSHLGLFYGPHKQQFTMTHTAVVTDPKTKRRKKQTTGLLSALNVVLEPGHAYHVALTWGEELTLAIDGKQIAGKARPGLVPGETAATLQDQVLIIGAQDHWVGRTAFLFDELRVSGRPRTVSELTQARPIKDAATVLLDHFSESFRPDGEIGRTQPDVCAGRDSGGVPTVGCAFIPMTNGTGVRAVVQPPRDWVDIASNDVGLTHALDWAWHKYMGRWDLRLEPEAYRARVQSAHDAGLQYYVYTYKCLPPAHLDYDEYFHEWGALPRIRWLNPTAQTDARNYDGDSACSNSPYNDYFVAAYEKTLKEYNLDGIYLDGSTKPMLCTNRNHGCGYQDEDGNWRGTYPIFTTREMLKRLYAVTHTNKPDGIVDVHESFCLCIPTTSFCDVIYTGEHEPFNPGRIDEVRVRYGRRAWGIPVEVLGSTPNHVFFHPRYWAYMLIHDARVRPAGAQARNDMQRKTAQIRRVFEPFRGPDCTWLPYYRPSPFTSPNPDVLISAWHRPDDDEYLLVVTYFGREPERIEARVKVGIKGARSAVNPLTLQSVPFTNGTLTVPIGFEEFRLVRLSPGR
ncbi:MAG: hypothetical protein HN742_07585 [Lentisphaerae bacterium]|nr:hypothetical protein [Lentisphaerota bacterium]MBT5609409.1 hypothetical protein [Lentisphaerota bacterium]MBT7841717.1 hypothetical protein [Lentisphaerota bacterium]